MDNKQHKSPSPSGQTTPDYHWTPENKQAMFSTMMEEADLQNRIDQSRKQFAEFWTEQKKRDMYTHFMQETQDSFPRPSN